MSGKPVRETSSTKYYGKITVYRYEDAWNPEQTETYSESFEATSIQSAKAKLTKIANAQELFSWVQSWDNETRTYTGKDLRWKPWSPPVSYEQKDGTPIGYSSRYSEREFGETVYPSTHKYGKSVEYRVDLTVYWRLKTKENPKG